MRTAWDDGEKRMNEQKDNVQLLNHNAQQYSSPENETFISEAANGHAKWT